MPLRRRAHNTNSTKDSERDASTDRLALFGFAPRAAAVLSFVVAAFLPVILPVIMPVLGGCSVDKAGFAGGGGLASTGGRPSAGTGGQVPAGGGGGAAGIGASRATGGGPGSGGATASGGAVGSGGDTGSGGTGAPGSGGRGEDGRSGGAGASPGTGGAGGTPVVGLCNALTCPLGCCMGNVCRAGRTDQRCGTAGVACAACPSCYQCSSTGVCGLTPGAVWDVICSSASLAPTMPANANGAWDTDGTGLGALPDPFCQFTRNGVAQATTTTLMNTLSPVWNQSIAPTGGDVTENFLVSQPWEVAVIDDDFGTTTNDLACSIAPQLTAADFAAGAVDLPPTRRCTAVRIELVCAE